MGEFGDGRQPTSGGGGLDARALGDRQVQRSVIQRRHHPRVAHTFDSPCRPSACQHECRQPGRIGDEVRTVRNPARDTAESGTQRARRPAVSGLRHDGEMPSRLTADAARRTAVAAQGFAEAKPAGAVTRAHLRRPSRGSRCCNSTPCRSRCGPTTRHVQQARPLRPGHPRPGRVDHSARAPRLLVEYWAHEAALMAVDDWPLLRWRMREYADGRWGNEIVRKHRQLAEDVLRPFPDSDRRRPADRGTPRVGAARPEGPVVGPQRHQMGGRGAVRRRAC